MENDQKPLTIQSKQDFWKAEEVKKKNKKEGENWNNIEATWSNQFPQIKSFSLKRNEWNEIICTKEEWQTGS